MDIFAGSVGECERDVFTAPYVQLRSEGPVPDAYSGREGPRARSEWRATQRRIRSL